MSKIRIRSVFVRLKRLLTALFAPPFDKCERGFSSHGDVRTLGLYNYACGMREKRANRRRERVRNNNIVYNDPAK